MSFPPSASFEAAPESGLIPRYLQLDLGVQLRASADFVHLLAVSTR